MNDDFYLGRMAYSFFLVCQGIVVVVASIVNHSFSWKTLFGFLAFVLILLLCLKHLYWNKSVSKSLYCKAQMVSFLSLSIWMCYAFENAYILFFMAFLQGVLSLLFVDSGVCQFQACISGLAVFVAGLCEFPGFSTKPLVLEDVFVICVIFIIDWLATNLIKQFKFQQRKSGEQERSLDDMLKVVEVKRDEATHAERSKAEFLSNMSHEIRTPINAVLGMNEMILRESKEEAVLGYAVNIENSGKMLLSLINDILDFSKIESGRMEIIPVGYQLSSVINDLMNMIVPRAKEKDLLLEVEVEPSVPNYLYGDEIRIRQIVTNLLTNAVKYTEKGTVTLRVDFRRTESKYIDLIFEVVDTGVGIKKDDIGKLFDSFQRVDQKNNRNIEGTGLGLAITSQFVELMNGRIDVESEYGIGSTFTAVIPQEVTKNTPIGDFKAYHKRAIKKNGVYKESFQAPEARLLVVDDNEMNLMVVEGLLKQTKIQIDTASSGMECLEKLRTEKYHILLLDHMMPVLDGVETLKAIKKEGLAPDMPVIALTANAISGAREMYLEYGFQDYLAKPIAGVALERMLVNWLPKELMQSSDEEKEKGVTESFANKLIDRETGLAYSAGSEEVYRKLLATYWKQGAKQLFNGNEFLKQEDWESYRRLLHDIKSTSLSIGALELSEAAKRIGKALKDGRIEEVRADNGEILAHYKKVLKEVRHILDKEPEQAH